MTTRQLWGRPCGRICWPALAALSLTLLAVDPASAEDPDGPIFPIGYFVLQYSGEHRDHPSLDELLPLDVELSRTQNGYAAPREGLPLEVYVLRGEPDATPQPFHASAIGAVAGRVLAALHEQGLLGVYVMPHPDDVAASDERDLRRPGDTILRLQVSTGRVGQVRTIGVGSRLPREWRINHPIHNRIKRRSPIQPGGDTLEGTTDLVRKDILEDYLFRLNRHPGRRVDAALSPSRDAEGVALDYQINESRPWFVYAQISNTGTRRTNPWQTRIGYVHRQLTNRDDIFSFEYLNSGFNDVNGVTGSYEAPWFGSERPSWARQSGDEPWWIRFANRDRVPWLGTERLRWSINGAWLRYEASDIDLTDDAAGTEWNVGSHVYYNVLQRRSFFVDLFTGFLVRDVDFLNQNTHLRAEAFFLIPDIGFRTERVNEYSTFRGVFSYEGSPLKQDLTEIQLLGRVLPDTRWQLFRWGFSGSSYLEPLINRKAWRDPTTPRSSTLAHEIAGGFRGQYAFDYRLVPQVEQVVGGLYSVRGYPQSNAVGDSIYMGSVEYRFHLAPSLPIRRKPVKLPWIGDFRLTPQHVYGRADWDLVLHGFVDAAYVVNNQTGGVIREPNQTLLGVGVGAELLFRNNLRFRFDWGRALNETTGAEGVPAGNNEFYFLFGILY